MNNEHLIFNITILNVSLVSFLTIPNTSGKLSTIPTFGTCLTITQKALVDSLTISTIETENK